MTRGDSDSNKSVREVLAGFAYRQWIDWIRYLFNNCQINEDGTATIPTWLVEQWQRQLQTPYAELDEYEKESNRASAYRLLSIVEFIVQHHFEFEHQGLFLLIEVTEDLLSEIGAGGDLDYWLRGEKFGGRLREALKLLGVVGEEQSSMDIER